MKPKTLKITAIVLASLAAFGVTAAAAYDSSEDPLVSLSYLTRIFKTELLEELNETIDNELDRRIENLDLSQYQTWQPPQTEEEEKEEPEKRELMAVPFFYAAIRLYGHIKVLQYARWWACWPNLF